MKCIKYTDGKVTRVNDSLAETMVNSGRAIYIPKSIWKMEIRDVVAVTIEKAIEILGIDITEVSVKPKKKREKKTKKEIKSEKNKLKKQEKIV